MIVSGLLILSFGRGLYPAVANAGSPQVRPEGTEKVLPTGLVHEVILLKAEVETLKKEIGGMKGTLAEARLGLKEFDVVITTPGGPFQGLLVPPAPGGRFPLASGSGDPIVGAWWSPKHNVEHAGIFPRIEFEYGGRKMRISSYPRRVTPTGLVSSG